MAKKFLRRSWDRYSRLGKGKKKKQKWKRPTGRHNKMREKRRGYPKSVSIGYMKNKKERKEINGKKPVIVQNIKDLGKIKNKEIAILGKIGKRKKIEIIKSIKEKNIPAYNINALKYLKILGKIEERKNKLKEQQKKTETKKHTPKELKQENKSEEIENVV